MHILLAVLQDFYTYARYLYRDARKFLRPLTRVQREEVLFLSYPSSESVTSHQGESAVIDEDVVEEPLPTFRSAADIFKAAAHPQKNTVMYTGAEDTAVFREPTAVFDGVIAKLPYGALVMALEQRGRWSRIVYREIAGWVLRDELIDRSAFVYPEFIIGAPNLPEDPNTLRLRACISDEFSGGKVELPLQSAEYVLYRLYRKNIIPVWPDVRPRAEGTWHTLLRGSPHARICVRPQNNAVMEYVREDGVGHVAYVDAVFPDDTISISEANFPDLGRYNERVLTKAEWQELRPVFLELR